MRLLGLGAMLCGAMVGVTAAWGAPGDFDLTFGDRGSVRAPFQSQALGQAIARQPDGKLLAAGVVYPAAGSVKLALVRYLADGSLDSSFGSGGVAAVNSAVPLARAILVQGDGKIVVVASVLIPGDPHILLVRYDAQGNLDPNFGSGGVTSTALPGAAAATNAVLQDDGKVVVATSSAGDVLVLRYGSDGALDPGFGTGGIATVDFAGSSDTAAAIVLDPVGVVVLGAADTGTASYTALARLDDTGALDPTFGNGGTILHDIGAGAPPQTMLRLGDGKLFVSAGGYAGAPAQFTGVFFARLNATGSLDPTFGAGGVLADASEYVITDLARTPDDKVIGVGSTGYALVVERFELDGSFDPGFGNAGVVETTLAGAIDYPEEIVVGPDGTIAMTGEEYSTCEPMNCDDFYHLAYRFYVVRFQGGTESCASDADCGPCESCGPAGACVFGPRTSCVSAQPHGASLQISIDPISDDLDRYRIRLKWRGATPLGFDPLTSDDVGMCIYFGDARVLRTVAPAGGVCGGIPCWRGHPGSFSYRDSARSSDGIAQLQLTAKKAAVDASGANLAKAMHGILNPGSAEVLSQPDILVQVHGGNGQCLQATLSDFKRKYRPIGPGALAVAGLRGVGQ
jgi:uncharacterized delta-60 repeat protein